ncbi:unnamed protein product, partial [Phaeothamnion confervicola]
MDIELEKITSRPPYPLSRMVEDIKAHMRDHDHGKWKSADCNSVMSQARRALPGLIEAHLRPDQAPSDVAEMCTFLSVFRKFSNNCEQALLLGGTDERATASWVLRLISLSVLPRFEALQGRFSAAARQLLRAWIPHNFSALAIFFDDAVELLQSTNVVQHVMAAQKCAARSSGGSGRSSGVSAAAAGAPAAGGGAACGAQITAFERLAARAQCPPLELSLASARHATLCRTALTALLAGTIAAASPFLCTGAAFDRFWSLLVFQIATAATPEVSQLHAASLEAVAALLPLAPPQPHTRRRLDAVLLEFSGRVLGSAAGPAPVLHPDGVANLNAVLHAAFFGAQLGSSGGVNASSLHSPPQLSAAAVPRLVVTQALLSAVAWWATLRASLS